MEVVKKNLNNLKKCQKSEKLNFLLQEDPPPPKKKKETVLLLLPSAEAFFAPGQYKSFLCFLSLF